MINCLMTASPTSWSPGLLIVSGLFRDRLTMRAKGRASPAQLKLLEALTARRAGLTGAVIDSRRIDLVEVVQIGVLCRQSFSLRSSLRHCFLQNGDDGSVQPPDFCSVQISGDAGRVQPRAMQALVAVDVSQAGHDALFEQNGLERSPSPGQSLSQIV